MARIAGRVMRRRRTLGPALAAASLVAGLLIAAPSAYAFATLSQEWDGDGTNQCGSTTAKLGTFRPCDVGFYYDSSITSRGWDAAVRAAAYDWCYHNDPNHGNQPDFCWEDVSNGGGTAGADISAADLGGAGANGSIVLGQDYNTAQFVAGYWVLTHNDSLTNAQVQLNDNAAATWYVNSGTSYTVPSNSWDFQTNAMHELGHALGLNHPTQFDSGPGTPVMACELYAGVYNHGSADDINGELWLYGGENSQWGSPQQSPC